jgi:hypothetical protein
MRVNFLAFKDICKDIKIFFWLNKEKLVIFLCIFAGLSIGGRYNYYKFYYFIQIIVLFYFIFIKEKLLKFNFFLLIFNLLFILLYFSIFFQTNILSTSNINEINSIDLSIFAFLLIGPIIDYNKINNLENSNPWKKKFLLKFSKRFKCNFEYNYFINLSLFIFFIIFLAFCLEPMSTHNNIVLNSRYRINFSDPNYSGFYILISTFILTLRFSQRLFFFTGILAVLVTGSRSTLLLFLMLLIFNNLKFNYLRIFLIFFLSIIFFNYSASLYIFSITNRVNPNNLIVQEIINSFCLLRVDYCMIFKNFVETGPLRTFDIFDDSLVHRLNVTGSIIKIILSEKFKLTLLPLNSLNFIDNSSYLSSHEFITSLVPRLGVIGSFILLINIYLLIKKSNFFIKIFAPLLVGSLFLGAQFFIFWPLIFLGFFYHLNSFPKNK